MRNMKINERLGKEGKRSLKEGEKQEEEWNDKKGRESMQRT